MKFNFPGKQCNANPKEGDPRGLVRFCFWPRQCPSSKTWFWLHLVTIEQKWTFVAEVQDSGYWMWVTTQIDEVPTSPW